ncbi:peptide deformylase [Aureibacillus halotolerans]|uniref:Peptide deformylase n=1 Tax=Aureibacillus halotolerans TaxID=1508390 RepID=A0A4V3D620_9BACI|nr:peptide deformylase [Aureibacillus halotolerans]TDQ42257.1 peptide deformylase [Aureibacillus halotolerans]
MITMEHIVREGHPSLRNKAEAVSIPPSAEEKALMKDMQEFLTNSQDEELAESLGLRPGVGLAAPQLGVEKQMIAVLCVDDKDRDVEYGLFNPRIISHSVEKSYLPGGEGCLSVDREVPGNVLRHARITVKGFDLNGKEVKLRLRGFPAIVFQHEIDHLNGVMFYDHIDQEQPFEVPEGAIPADR